MFNKKDPYILGIDVLEGTLRLGTPVVIPDVKWTGDPKTQNVAPPPPVPCAACLGAALPRCPS